MKRNYKIACMIAALCFLILRPGLGSAALVTSYELSVVNDTSDSLQGTYATVPQFLEINGAYAAATSDSLNAESNAYYFEPNEIYVGGASSAVLRIATDTLTNFQISFDYEIDSNGPGWATVSIAVIGGSNWWTQSVDNGSGSQYGSYSGIIPVGAGNDLYLYAYTVLGNGQAGNYNLAEITNLRVTSSPVPLPASVLLMASGIIGLIGFRRKFKTDGGPES